MRAASRFWSALIVSLPFMACMPSLIEARPPAAPVDPDFKPELVAVELTSPAVRPGDRFAVTLKFRNGGTKPARRDYAVFLHFEAPKKECGANIVVHDDHPPAEPTSLWQPGETVTDGPRILTAPVDRPDQRYFIHVGVYDQGFSGQRLLDVYPRQTLSVSSTAPSAEQLGPGRLAAAEVARRRHALAARTAPGGSVATLETRAWRFDVARGSGAWSLLDKSTGVAWTSDPTRPQFGEMLMVNGDRSARWRIDHFDAIEVRTDRLRLVCKPQVDGRPSGLRVEFTLAPMAEPSGLRMDYCSAATSDWRLRRVRLLDGALAVTEEDQGRFYIPHRLGIERLAAQAFPGRESWRTYDTLSMAMCGAVKQGSALLVNWESVDARLELASSWADEALVAGRRACALSLVIDAPQGGCSLHPLARGDYVQIAQAYRPLAQTKGWRQTWAEKRDQYPSVPRMFGASDFKPFVLSRSVPGSRHNRDGREHVHLGFTFDEAAQCAEHWRHDLGIDRAFVVLAGWIHRGYDVGHPDVLPAAPECGGNEGLARAAARIRACGYLFGLHDNYQDMYVDAPSFGQQWLNKNAQGVAKKGGNWAGGQAWQVCAIKQVELAARPATNLPQIARLFAPTIYFIDTVFAWPLVTCEDPAHPMTRLDDLRWKTRLCLLAKQHFGLFGSEEGREWAVPCADYLEGIFGHQTDSPPGSVVPLFPLVYHDCVQLTTHQSNRIAAGDEKKMADHVLFAEMSLPSFGEHLYWKEAAAGGLKLAPLAPRVEDLGGRRFSVTYRWKLDEPIVGDGSIFVHFAQPQVARNDGILFQDDHAPRQPLSRWRPGIVEDGPPTVSVPADFQGQVEVRVGVLHNHQRVVLAGGVHEGMSYRLGTLTVRGSAIEFEPLRQMPAAEIWSRGDGGWGERLCPADRVIKNTWEVLSPLNAIAAERPLADHQFLTADRLVARTRFGDLTISVAYEKPARLGDNAVPAYGFIAESPQFVAFCATRYAGRDYPQPALFTARSLDGRPIAESSRVRIYHGFGDRRIRLAGKDFEVAGEEIVAVK
jgi:hypothetical protein